MAIRTDGGPIAASAASSVRELVGGDVRTVRVTFADLHGIQRGKDVPIAEFEHVARQGLMFCWAVMGTDLRHTPVVGGEQGYPDMVARPDLRTLAQLPWEPDVAVCLADLERAGAEGRAGPTDPRDAARRAAAACDALGYEVAVGPELEFFLCERDAGPGGGLRRCVDHPSMVYTVGPQADPRGFLRALMDGCARFGIGAFAGNHEYMNSQYELNLRHGEALAAADRAFRFKAAVKDLAAIQGLLATFVGKPFNDQGGSGFHLHISLSADEANAFDDPAAEHGLSVTMRRFMAGTLHHAPALTALLCPTVNAYRRLMPDSLAPTHVNWGLDNRGTFIRVPPERGGGTRIEMHVGDGAANPYLAIAACLFAGVDGVRHELEPPAPLAGDAYRAPEPGPPLPRTLDDALDALEADRMLVEALGPELVETLLTVKRFETERHRMWTSQWELDEYLHHL